MTGFYLVEVQKTEGQRVILKEGLFSEGQLDRP